MGSSVGVGDVVVVLFAGMGAFFSPFPSPRLHQFALSICLARNVGVGRIRSRGFSQIGARSAENFSLYHCFFFKAEIGARSAEIFFSISLLLL